MAMDKRQTRRLLNAVSAIVGARECQSLQISRRSWDFDIITDGEAVYRQLEAAYKDCLKSLRPTGDDPNYDTIDS